MLQQCFVGPVYVLNADQHRRMPACPFDELEKRIAIAGGLRCAIHRVEYGQQIAGLGQIQQVVKVYLESLVDHSLAHRPVCSRNAQSATAVRG